MKIYIKNGFNSRKVFVRGLCASAYFDTEYFLNLGENGKIVFTGFLNSLLIFDEVCVNYISVCLSNFLNQSFFLFYVFDNTSNYIYTRSI